MSEVASRVFAGLTGTWRSEHVFCLARALALYDTYRQLIAQADEQLEAMIVPLRQHADTVAPNKDKGRAKNAPRFAELPARFVLLRAASRTVCENLAASTCPRPEPA